MNSPIAMNPITTGYYSVIQYCPDRSRMEAANIGVLLFVESMDYLKVRIASGNDRIRRFFRDLDLDLESINLTKRMVEHRFEVEKTELHDREGLNLFLHRFANEIIFTELRPVRVESPEVELTQLYDELVGGRVRLDPAVPAIEHMCAVRQRLEQPDVAAKLQRNLLVTVPVLEDEVEADYAFQNGRFNLIQVREFTQQRPDALYREACKTAAEGHLIYKHPDAQRHEQQLMLVASFSEQAQEFSGRISRLMEEHDVKFFNESDIDQLVELIRTTAH